MADSDIVERLEKQIEGSNLALAAVAEVLHKMDSRLAKAEEEDFELSEAEADEVEKQEIIKAVAGEVYGLIKADSSNPTGAQWGKSSDVSASGTGKSASNADDAEKSVTIDSKTENANRTIQAMQKQLDLLKESLEQGYGYENIENAGYGMDRSNGNGGGADDEPVDDETEEEKRAREEEEEEGAKGENPFDNSVQKMSIQKMVQQETENRLRKMGFHEENGLNSPKLIRYSDALGVDGVAPITKSGTVSADDTVDQMMNMSYSDLRKLQEAVESGETDGIPRELLG